MTDEEKKSGNRLIAAFMGYPYYHHGITIDVGKYWKDFQSVEIFSKVHIETIDDPDECYFKEIPNPNYKNSDDPNDKYRGKLVRWDRLNSDNYMHDLKYDWDWNRLMAAWKEFWNKNSECYTVGNNHEMKDICSQIESALFYADIEEAFKKLVEGIKLYNEQKIK